MPKGPSSHLWSISIPTGPMRSLITATSPSPFLPTMLAAKRTRPSATRRKEEEQWELDTYVTCEVLGWRGVWNSEERRRLGNNDLGQSLYYGFPYYGRWIWAAARMLVDKKHVSLTELLEKIAEVKARNVQQ